MLWRRGKGCWLGQGTGSSSAGQGPRGPGSGGLEVSPHPHYRHFSLPAPLGCPAGPGAELRVRGALGSHPASPQTCGSLGGLSPVSLMLAQGFKDSLPRPKGQARSFLPAPTEAPLPGNSRVP